jgi:hypothetical protein
MQKANYLQSYEQFFRLTPRLRSRRAEAELYSAFRPLRGRRRAAHELDCSPNFSAGQFGASTFWRHGAKTFDCVIRQRLQALAIRRSLRPQSTRSPAFGALTMTFAGA